MIEMSSSRRITKVSRVFPWAYKYTSRVDRVWPLRGNARGRFAHERANYCNEEIRLEIRTHICHIRAQHGAGTGITRPDSRLPHADYAGARWRRIPGGRAILHARLERAVAGGEQAYAVGGGADPDEPGSDAIRIYRLGVLGWPAAESGDGDGEPGDHRVPGGFRHELRTR